VTKGGVVPVAPKTSMSLLVILVMTGMTFATCTGAPELVPSRPVAVSISGPEVLILEPVKVHVNFVQGLTDVALSQEATPPEKVNNGVNPNPSITKEEAFACKGLVFSVTTGKDLNTIPTTAS
jgi:hypothetical protein